MNMRLAIGIIVLIIALFFFISYKKDITVFYQDLEQYHSKILKTSMGKVEYLEQGEGIPVLVVHGIAGGFDQALQTGYSLTGGNHRIIGVSRFGYLNSDLPEESTPQNQAEAYKELLDYLQIDKAVIIAVSAGGAPALKFALNYPERTRALIMVGAGSPTREEIKGPTGPPHFIINDFVFWFMLKNMRSAMFSMFAIDKEKFIKSSSAEKQTVESLFATLLPIKPRKPGMINDETITNLDMAKNYDQYHLEEISVPTLIIHAQDDPLASYQNAKRMSARIPGAKYFEFIDGGHILFGHGKEINHLIDDFIKEQQK